MKCRLAVHGLLNHFELLKRDHSSWAQSFLICTGNPGTQLVKFSLLPSDHFHNAGPENKKLRSESNYEGWIRNLIYQIIALLHIISLLNILPFS